MPADLVPEPEKTERSPIDNRQILSIVYESYLTQLTSDMTPIVPSEVEKEIASSPEAPTSYPAGTFRPRVAGLPSLPQAHLPAAFTSRPSSFPNIPPFPRPRSLAPLSY